MLYYGYYDCALRLLPVSPCSVSFSLHAIPVSRKPALYPFDMLPTSFPLLSFLYAASEGLVLQDVEYTGCN